MSLDALLIHTATILRATETLDPLGNARRSYYEAGVTPCRLVQKRQRVWSDQRAESVVVTSPILLVPASVDVQERDQVLVESVTYTITAVLARNTRAPHHQSLAVEVVT